jgi:hypothetical protein
LGLELGLELRLLLGLEARVRVRVRLFASTHRVSRTDGHTFAVKISVRVRG